MADYWLHPDIYDPNEEPSTGIFAHLMRQEYYPSLYSASKFTADSAKDGSRTFKNMDSILSTINNKDQHESRYSDEDTAEKWEKKYIGWAKFDYPDQLSAPLRSLTEIYYNITKADPDSNVTSVGGGGGKVEEYDPSRILTYMTIVNKQREFAHQYSDAFMSRTKTHQEAMFNVKSDLESADALDDDLWSVAYGLWMRYNNSSSDPA